MATVKVRLNKSRLMKDGSFAIVFQIIHKRRKKLIYSGLKINAKQFDSERGKVVRHPDFANTNYCINKMNKQIEQTKKNISAIITTFESKGVPYTVSMIIGQYILEKKNQDKYYLFTYFNQRIIFKQKIGKVGIMEAYRSTRASIERYRGRTDIKLSEVTALFVKEYSEFLQINNVSANSIAYYMRNFRTIYKYAIEQCGCEKQNDDPFKNACTQPCKTAKRALKREALLKMVNADFSSMPRVDLARDLFLFSFYCRGMALVDIIYLTKNNISDGVITYSRRKTGQTLSVLLTEQLNELIAKYATTSNYLFPLMKDGSPESMYSIYRLALRNTNDGLKSLAKILNIDHDLTTYVARHTWATQAKEHGASISVISEGLGHSSEKTTTIYLKQFDRSVLDQVNEVVTKLR